MLRENKITTSPKFKLLLSPLPKYWYLKKRKYWIWGFIFLSLVSALTYTVQIYVAMDAYYNPASHQFNYFLEAEEHAKMGYIVFTPTCRILNISAWDKSVLPFLSTVKVRGDCSQARQWTYVNNTNVVINVTAVENSGYSLSSISCCYRPIKRVEQSAMHYDSGADERIFFSGTCKPMQTVTPVEDEFVRVFCKSKYWPLSFDVIYRYFHAVALPEKSSKTTEKIKFWRRNKSTDTQKKQRSGDKSYKNTIDPQLQVERPAPPNVVLFGIDSMSRLSFQRNMGKTRKYLQEIGAVEMLGYNKVGENTFPNAVAFSSGYHEEDLQKFCYFSTSTRQDLCPYIWKRFDKANYLTAFVEDAPLLATYNYFKTGFVEQPVDYYFRPFMLGVHYHSANMHFTIDCIGRQTVDETVHKYMGDLLQMSDRRNTPIFLYTWLTNLAHSDLNAAQFADDTYTQFLKSLDLNNTLLFFMSDHGYRYGLIRQTFPGWYEDKLPNFWVYLPPTLKNRFPSWKDSLQINSQRLTSPMDLYRTMSQILDEFTDTKEPPDERSRNGTLIKRRFGQSLFTEVPITRKCQDAGISENLCACVVPQRLNANDKVLISAANAAILHINRILPKQCSPLKLQSITAGAVMDHQNDRPNEQTLTYIVAFETNPGSFLIEANVESVNHSSTEFVVSGNLLRMNKITTDVSCVHDDILERFCYCS